MNDTQTNGHGAYMAIIGSIGMSVGFGLTAVLNAFLFQTPNDWWLIGGPVGMGLSMLVYSVIVGWGKAE